MNCTQNQHHQHNNETNLVLANEILELKKPIKGEVVERKMLLIRDNEVIGELPMETYENTIIFLDAFNNIIP